MLNLYYKFDDIMEKRLNLIATMNLLSYLLLGLTHVFKWSPVVALVAFILSVAVLGLSLVNMFLACKEGPVSRKFHLKRIIYQMVIAIILVVIYIGRFN